MQVTHARAHHGKTVGSLLMASGLMVSMLASCGSSATKATATSTTSTAASSTASTTASTAASSTASTTGSTTPATSAPTTGAPLAPTPNAGNHPGVTDGEIKLGLLTSLTGFASTSFGSDVVVGANAAIGQVNAAGGINGRKLTLVTEDDASASAQDLTAFKSLEDKGVFGVIEATPLFFASYREAVTQGIPVTGTANDGPEWGDRANANLFSAYGSPNNTYPTFTTLGSFLKDNGVTKLGAVGYANSPSSLANTAANVASAKAAGVDVPFQDVAQKFGSAVWDADAIAMKNAGVDGISAIMGTSDNVALLVALKQQGVTIKADFIADGYQQGILDNPTALAAAQGVMFSSRAQPVQLNTPATQAFQKALATYGNYTAANPTQGLMYGWFATLTMIKGLQVAGQNPTWGGFVQNLHQVTDYDGGGMLSPISYANIGFYDALGAGGCWYQSKVVGSAFVPVSTKPYCGTAIPGTHNG